VVLTGSGAGDDGRLAGDCEWGFCWHVDETTISADRGKCVWCDGM